MMFNPFRVGSHTPIFVRGFRPSVGFVHPVGFARPWVSPTVIHVQPLQGWKPHAHFRQWVSPVPWVSPVRGFRPRLFMFNPCRVGSHSPMFVCGFRPSVGFAHGYSCSTLAGLGATRPFSSVGFAHNQVQPLQGCGVFTYSIFLLFNNFCK